jgi:hypothetical protein
VLIARLKQNLGEASQVGMVAEFVTRSVCQRSTTAMSIFLCGAGTGSSFTWANWSAPYMYRACSF